jgi:hypothetical protein
MIFDANENTPSWMSSQTKTVQGDMAIEAAD